MISSSPQASSSSPHNPLAEVLSLPNSLGRKLLSAFGLSPTQAEKILTRSARNASGASLTSSLRQMLLARLVQDPRAPHAQDILHGLELSLGIFPGAVVSLALHDAELLLPVPLLADPSSSSSASPASPASPPPPSTSPSTRGSRSSSTGNAFLKSITSVLGSVASSASTPLSGPGGPQEPDDLHLYLAIHTSASPSALIVSLSATSGNNGRHYVVSGLSSSDLTFTLSAAEESLKLMLCLSPRPISGTTAQVAHLLSRRGMAVIASADYTLAELMDPRRPPHAPLALQLVTHFHGDRSIYKSYGSRMKAAGFPRDTRYVLEAGTASCAIAPEAQSQLDELLNLLRSAPEGTAVPSLDPPAVLDQAAEALSTQCDILDSTSLIYQHVLLPVAFFLGFSPEDAAQAAFKAASSLVASSPTTFGLYWDAWVGMDPEVAEACMPAEQLLGIVQSFLVNMGTLFDRDVRAMAALCAAYAELASRAGSDGPSISGQLSAYLKAAAVAKHRAKVPAPVNESKLLAAIHSLRDEVAFATDYTAYAFDEHVEDPAWVFTLASARTLLLDVNQLLFIRLDSHSGSGQWAKELIKVFAGLRGLGRTWAENRDTLAPLWFQDRLFMATLYAPVLFEFVATVHESLTEYASTLLEVDGFEPIDPNVGAYYSVSAANLPQALQEMVDFVRRLDDDAIPTPVFTQLGISLCAVVKYYADVTLEGSLVPKARSAFNASTQDLSGPHVRALTALTTSTVAGARAIASGSKHIARTAGSAASTSAKVVYQRLKNVRSLFRWKDGSGAGAGEAGEAGGGGSGSSDVSTEDAELVETHAPVLRRVSVSLSPLVAFNNLLHLEEQVVDIFAVVEAAAGNAAAAERMAMVAAIAENDVEEREGEEEGVVEVGAEVPHREVEVWENGRRETTLSPFGPSWLAHEPHALTRVDAPFEQARVSMLKKGRPEVDGPGTWEWTGNWKVGQWEYARHWNASFGDGLRDDVLVRRRKWTRTETFVPAPASLTVAVRPVSATSESSDGGENPEEGGGEEEEEGGGWLSVDILRLGTTPKASRVVEPTTSGRGRGGEGASGGGDPSSLLPWTTVEEAVSEAGPRCVRRRGCSLEELVVSLESGLAFVRSGLDALCDQLSEDTVVRLERLGMRVLSPDEESPLPPSSALNLLGNVLETLERSLPTLIPAGKDRVLVQCVRAWVRHCFGLLEVCADRGLISQGGEMLVELLRFLHESIEIFQDRTGSLGASREAQQVFAAASASFARRLAADDAADAEGFDFLPEFSGTREASDVVVVDTEYEVSARMGGVGGVAWIERGQGVFGWSPGSVASYTVSGEGGEVRVETPEIVGMEVGESGAVVLTMLDGKAWEVEVEGGEVEVFVEGMREVLLSVSPMFRMNERRAQRSVQSRA